MHKQNRPSIVQSKQFPDAPMDISDALTFCNLYSAGHRRAAHPVLLTENRPEIPVSLRKKPAAGMVPRVPAIPTPQQYPLQKYLRGYGHLPAGVV